MGARNKLNGSYFLGSFLIASMVGGLIESLWGFIIAVVVLLGVNLYGGDIRLRK